MSINYDAYVDMMVDIAEDGTLLKQGGMALTMIMLAILSDESGKCIPSAVDEASLSEAIDQISKDLGVNHIVLMSLWQSILNATENSGLRIMPFSERKDTLQ